MWGQLAMAAVHPSRGTTGHARPAAGGWRPGHPASWELGPFFSVGDRAARLWWRWGRGEPPRMLSA